MQILSPGDYYIILDQITPNNYFISKRNIFTGDETLNSSHGIVEEITIPPPPELSPEHKKLVIDTWLKLTETQQREVNQNVAKQNYLYYGRWYSFPIP